MFCIDVKGTGIPFQEHGVHLSCLKRCSQRWKEILNQQTHGFAKILKPKIWGMIRSVGRRFLTPIVSKGVLDEADILSVCDSSTTESPRDRASKCASLLFWYLWNWTTKTETTTLQSRKINSTEPIVIRRIWHPSILCRITGAVRSSEMIAHTHLTWSSMRNWPDDIYDPLSKAWVVPDNDWGDCRHVWRWIPARLVLRHRNKETTDSHVFLSVVVY